MEDKKKKKWDERKSRQPKKSEITPVTDLETD